MRTDSPCRLYVDLRHARVYHNPPLPSAKKYSRHPTTNINVTSNSSNDGTDCLICVCADQEDLNWGVGIVETAAVKLRAVRRLSGSRDQKQMTA